VANDEQRRFDLHVWQIIVRGVTPIAVALIAAVGVTPMSPT
jgi:hypothetical protein